MATVEKAAPKLIPVQTFGRKKFAAAVAYVKPGTGLITVNGRALDHYQPEILRLKLQEPMLIVGQDKFANLNIRVRVTGGGYVSQIYAVRQAVAKGLIAFYHKNVDEQSRRELKEQFAAYDRTLLVADPRATESKKFGGPGARARFQKSYR